MKKPNCILILWSNLLLFLFFITLPSPTFAQDIYNAENSRKYAQYLFNSHNYGSAANEFERVLFLSPKDDTLTYYLLRSYLLDHNIEKGIKRAEELYPDPNVMPEKPALEYVKLNLRNNDLVKVSSYVQSAKNISPDLRNTYMLNIAMLQSDLERASLILKEDIAQPAHVVEKYNLLIGQGYNLKHKSPLLAGGLSAVVPGLGKVYSRDFKDGIVSFVFVGMSAFQAYRFYQKRGAENALTIVFGGIAAGFYLGNIYGSVKSAKNFNKQVKGKYEHEVRNYIYSTF